MPTNISTITIQSTPQKLWDALTNPAVVRQWQYGSELATDWQEGSDIRFVTKWEDKVFEQWGKILQFEPHRIIRYSLFFPRPELEDKPENYFFMSYILHEEQGKVRLEVIQEDNRPGAVQEEDKGEENEVLNALKVLVES